MLISFSGPQSSGKTTLLNYLSERNPNIKFVPEVTRLIKREYNLPINEDGNVLTQMLIMAEHVRNAFHSDNKKVDTILDRCSMDGLIYTHWLCNQGLDMVAYSFARIIYAQTISKYDVIFYTSPDDVKLVDDGERSVNIKFREDIISLFEKHLHDNLLPNVTVLKGSVEERLHTIKETLIKKGIDIKI